MKVDDLERRGRLIVDISVVTRLRDTNNVRLIFHRRPGGKRRPMIIGRKQFVLMAEQTADALEAAGRWPLIAECARRTATRARAELWPRTV